MATTLTACVLTKGRLSLVHTGDSRALLLRGEGVQQLTTDQTEVARLLREGAITRKAAIDYPRRNVLDSALGIEGNPDLECFQGALDSGDRLVLTSDGAHSRFTKRELRDLTKDSENPASLTAKLARLVRRRRPDDNFTILAVFAN
jgi:protein phosphatase